MPTEMPAPPAFNLADLATAATTASSARTFLAVGGGVLLLSLLWHLALEVWRTVAGQQEKINYLTPIGRALVFAFLLGSYATIVTKILLVINSLGTLDGATGRAETLFLKRVLAFQKTVDASTTTFGFFSNLTFDSMRVALTQFLTWISYLFTLALVYVLKHLQAFTLAAIINYGPVLLGFASLGGFFGNLALSWFWALVETACWGVTMNILLMTFDKVPITVADGAASTPLFWTEITVNIVFAVAIASVPALTSSLIKGGSMASLGSKAAGGVLIAGGITAAAIRSAPARGQAAFSAAKDLAGKASGGAANVAALARGISGRRSAGAQNGFMAAAQRAAMGGGGSPGGGGLGGGGAANARARHFAIKSASQRKGG
jgi:hypothetical protein